MCTLQVRFLLSPFAIFSVAVWIYFSRLQNIGAKLFRIWKTCHQAHKQHKYPHASFVCTLQVRFLLSPFSLVSLAVWIYFNRLQNTAPLELNYFVFETFYLLPFLASMSRPQGPFSIHFILFYGGGFFVQAAVGSFGLTTRLSFSNKWSNFINIKQLSDS